MKQTPGRKPRVPIGEHARIQKAARLRKRLAAMLREISQDALAKKYGVSANVISFIENGGRYKSFWRAYDE